MADPLSPRSTRRRSPGGRHPGNLGAKLETQTMSQNGRQLVMSQPSLEVMLETIYHQHLGGS